MGTNTGKIVILTVTAATPSITGVTATPSITYGATSITLTGTVGVSGLYPPMGEIGSISATINGQTVTGSFINSTGGFSITYNDPSLPTDGVGSSPFQITYAYSGDSLLNASANNTSTSLTVNPAALGITANGQSKTYGIVLTFPASSAAFTPNGLKNGENVGSVTLSDPNNGGAGTASVGGSYPLAPSAATGGTFTPGNYTISYNNGALTVTKAGLSITANNQNKNYGSILTFPVSSGAFTPGGLQNGETVGSVTLSDPNNGGVSNAPIGSYPLAPSAATGGSLLSGKLHAYI